MNVWFGQSWGAEMCRLLPHVPVPIGEPCRWCEEPIEFGDSGWGQSAHANEWFHIECFTRMLVGSVGHQLGVCLCKGGDYEDSPNLTIREAAKAAFEQALSIGAQRAPYIVCPRCGAVSHHPKDISERYCGRCHRFHNEAHP
jgi:hypothetical protein